MPRPPVNVTARMRNERVNPQHPEGSMLYTSRGHIYVVDAAREMWAIFSPGQLRGWYPGTEAVVYVLQGGNQYHVTVRGIVDIASHTSSGNVPNVPVRAYQFVNIRD